ncbi:MAG: response regulator [Bacteriovoracia bacterium]
MKILVVDDEKIISSSLQRVLTRAGHEVMVANNGVEALRIISENKKFEVVFLDLLMPEIGGAEVLDFAKRAMPQAKVLMMTAYGDLSVKEDLVARGALRVLAKPFDDITLIPQMVTELGN